jgi:hypothetical protein
MFDILKKRKLENTTFQKLGLFPSSDEGERYLLDPVSAT